MTDKTELDKAIDGLTAALISEAPAWEQRGMLEAICRALLVVLLKLREEGA